MKKIKLSIQEIVNDFYSLGEEEGYITGLSEGFQLSDKNKKEYHNFMINMIEKYLPNWKEKINNKYFETENDDEKGIILSTTLYNNFKEIFYQLI